MANVLVLRPHQLTRPSGAGPRTLTRLRFAVGVGILTLPLLRPSGPGNTSIADVGVLVAVAAVLFWAASDGRRLAFPYLPAVGVMAAGGALAALRVGGVGALTVVQDLFVLAWAVALANACREPAVLRTALRTWALSGVGWAAVMLVGVVAQIPALSGVTAAEGSRASLTFGDPNVAASYFVVSLLVLRAARVPSRAGLRLACCGLLVAAVVFTGSNGGTLTLLVTVTVGWVLAVRARRGAIAAVAAGCLAVLVAVTVASTVSLADVATRAQRSAPLLRDSIGRTDESQGSRQTLGVETLNLWYADSLLGFGPSGTKNALAAQQSPYVKEAHDDYVAALVERGIIGAVGMLLLVGTLLARGVRVARRPLFPAHAAAVPRPELLLAAVLATLLASALYEILHFRHVWALYGVVAALRTDDLP